ncbi:FxsA family protein [Actinopolymorpha alba]|uniref:FxsA family protein n=1 Tax=Actinopolymorpha alba TaxID=533267 RepID=UPI00039C988B|nr:FxsA family protein [Actinopolymorpha alba]
MPLLALLALIGLPLLEIYVIIQVGQVIGGWWTLAALLTVSAAGLWLVKREGRRTWRALNRALEERRPPDGELLDAGLVLVGGALMVAPGFVTDAAGLALLFPGTRPVTRRMLRWVLGRRLARQMERVRRANGGPGVPAGSSPGPVIEGEVVDRRETTP